MRVADVAGGRLALGTAVMASSKGNQHMAHRASKNDQRTHQERARLYAARTAFRDGQITRRSRDNVIACVAGAVLIAGVFASQTVHAQVNAPAPEPTETSVPAPVETPSPTDTPAPTGTPAPASTPDN